jgi:hypothetical protein
MVLECTLTNGTRHDSHNICVAGELGLANCRTRDILVRIIGMPLNGHFLDVFSSYSPFQENHLIGVSDAFCTIVFIFFCCGNWYLHSLMLGLFRLGVIVILPFFCKSVNAWQYCHRSVPLPLSQSDLLWHYWHMVSSWSAHNS